MTELVPTPNDCPLPRRRADFATFTEAVDYAAMSAKGLNFHDARGVLERVYPYSQLRADALDWAYRLAALAVTDNPVKRWPGLAVGPEVAMGDRIRTGLDRFVAVCMACHRFNGDGEGEQGPDLARPMNVTEYFQIPALKKLIRNPASVRQWPEQKMPGFDQAALSDSDLDAIVDWLAYKAKQRR